MKRSFLPILAALGLLAGGCGLKWQVVQDPFPNFHLIERRADSQDQQIGTAVQNDQLPRPVAQALSDNVALVRQLAWQYQNPEGGQTMDLNAAQTRYLGTLLNDNQLALNDALTRTSQWANAFQGGWNYDFNYVPDRRLYIAVLHHQLVEQQAMVEDAYAKGSLNSAQVADLRSRIQVIHEAEWDDYNQNGSLDLTRDQMQELSAMVDDNYRYLRFRAQYQGTTRRWSGDRFDSWGQYKKTFDVTPATLPAASPTSGNRYWDGRPVRVKPTPAAYVPPPPTATPVPSRPTPRPFHPTWTPAPPPPTATPVPPAPTPVPPAPVPTASSDRGQDQGNQKDQGKHEGSGKKDHEDGQGQDQGNQKDQGKHEGSDKKDQGDQGPKNDKGPAVKAKDSKEDPKNVQGDNGNRQNRGGRKNRPNNRREKDRNDQGTQDDQGNHPDQKAQDNQGNPSDQKAQDSPATPTDQKADPGASSDDQQDQANPKNHGRHRGHDQDQ